jgi:hypothetical protein
MTSLGTYDLYLCGADSILSNAIEDVMDDIAAIHSIKATKMLEQVLCG